MDLRSIKPGLSAVSMVHPTIVDPETGKPLVAIGVTKRGLPIWPFMGGAPDDDDAGDGDGDGDGDADEDEDESDEDEDSDDDSDDDDEDKEKGKGKKNLKARVKALEEEKDRHFRKAKKEAKRADAAEAALAELRAKYESGDGDKDDKGKDEKPKDDSKIKAAEAAAQKLRVENAFLRVNEVEWIKPEQALALMLADDDYEVEFDDDGKVDRKSLKAELKRFAKANPHLVKQPKQSKGDDDSDDAGDDDRQRRTAPNFNGKRKGKGKTAPTRDELAKKFPALNRLT